ncbi:MAG: alpha-hydroxy-acid oxidizing protein [Planctomycetes bacterium]|nr:alpha-hydroxy-acid oxidizing protein [Planctomycetota bacterium]
MPSTRRRLLLSAGALASASLFTRCASVGGAPAPESAPDPFAGPLADPAFADAVSVSDLHAIALRRMPPMAREFIEGAAADEISLRWNREAYDRIRLDPRVLRDVSRVDTRVKLLGLDLAFPVLLAPTALHKLVHSDGELATVRGAGAAQAAMTLSTMSSVTLEDVARASSGPLWFQLYVQKDRGFTAELVQRAEKAGYKALVVTVDTPVGGARNRQERAKFRLLPGVEMANLRGLPSPGGKKLDTEKDAFMSILPERLTWKDIEWLQSLTKLPVLLKGVLNADDAELAAKQGLAGVLVSNHGARNLDTVPASIDALPRITDKVGGRMVVLVDGGVRRGTDVLKALAFGANAVLVGRPIFYGLSSAGAEGVQQMLAILRRELELAMALTGRASIAEIDRSVLWA